MSILRESLFIYKENLSKIVILGFTILLPVQILLTIISNYLYFNYGMADLLFIADWINGICVLISISVVSIPFIQIAKNTVMEENSTLTSTYDAFMRYMLPVYLVSIPYVIAVSLGMLVLLIPGIIISVLFFAFPFVFVIEGETWKESIKKAYAFGKSHFINLLLVIILFTLMEWLISMLTMFMTNLFTESYLIILSVNFLASVFYFPIFYFFITVKYLNWIGEGKMDTFST
ncbi:hypothetical protein JOE21_003073 [Desmospora profundinema]|uniref:Glycerophosphoryl diester phosphodiesterase membrane domain-containing protein n=1 Tax=Desmospora profundinema TaxID=1571184 RepID=A0ABU1IQS8_9BACL|nr:hypothetical protein [Desmospora profundinema]